jgi:hypothetical protein
MNKIYNIGDSIIVDVKFKQRGTTKITSVSHNFNDINYNKGYSVEYRIIEDDLFYSDWKDNIIGTIVKSNEYIRIRYTRVGSNSDGFIEFNSVEFNGEYTPENINMPTLNKSIFADIANDEKTRLLTRNIFKKLYFRGIIPMYVSRGDNINSQEDEDYISLFHTISRFFAIILCFFKRFENFFNDEELMLEWIRQNGLYFDEFDVNLETLQYLSQNFYDEIRKRGTNMIFYRQGDVFNNKTINIDGEFIRLIRSKKNDELLYENISLDRLGWCLGKSSPLYRGTAFAKNLNKTKEDSDDFIDINNFLTFKDNNSSNISIIDDEDKRVLNLKCIGDSYCGLGRKDVSVDVSDKIYSVNPNMDYEITFMIKINTAGDNLMLYFGAEGFDNQKHKLLDSFIANNIITEYFFSELSLSNFIQEKWYFIRGIIHAYSSEDNHMRTNIGFGNNLIFNNKFIKYILPRIYISASNYSNVSIWNYKIRPLVRGTNILELENGSENSHSLGFIQCPEILYMYFKNNNNGHSKNEITNIIEKYLLPYNVTDILQFIDSEE